MEKERMIQELTRALNMLKLQEADLKAQLEEAVKRRERENEKKSHSQWHPHPSEAEHRTVVGVFQEEIASGL